MLLLGMGGRTLSSNAFLGIPSLLHTIFECFGLSCGSLLAGLGTQHNSRLGHWMAVLLVVDLTCTITWVHDKLFGALVLFRIIRTCDSKLEI